MDEKFGMVMFEGRMYNLDDMNGNELNELMMRMEAVKDMRIKELEILCDIYKTDDKKEEGTNE